jgi:hypothetical protein
MARLWRAANAAQLVLGRAWEVVSEDRLPPCAHAPSFEANWTAVVGIEFDGRTHANHEPVALPRVGATCVKFLGR